LREIKIEKNELLLLLKSILMTQHLSKLILLFILWTGFGEIQAQNWELAKEKDGISIFTRNEPNSKYKAFKGEVEFQTDILEAGEFIENVENFDIWNEDISEIRLLEYEKGKSIRYYVVYDTPWPVTDRDLGISATISVDTATGGRVIMAVSAPEAVPTDPDRIRIVDYWQKWTIVPAGNGLVHITIEGYANPAGDVPAWLVNLAITGTPLDILREIRKSLQK
jgi:hypothetical protein